MTNYNDGNWHGWNGGECPVHPQTVVEVVVDDTYCTIFKEEETANFWCWKSADAPIIAFRVVKEYKEPREFWLNVYAGSAVYFYKTKEDADRSSSPNRLECIHVREVIE